MLLANAEALTLNKGDVLVHVCIPSSPTSFVHPSYFLCVGGRYLDELVPGERRKPEDGAARRADAGREPGRGVLEDLYPR